MNKIFLLKNLKTNRDFQCCFFTDSKKQCKNKAVYTIYSKIDPRPIYDKYFYICKCCLTKNQNDDDIIQDINLPV